MMFLGVTQDRSKDAVTGHNPHRPGIERSFDRETVDNVVGKPNLPDWQHAFIPLTPDCCDFGWRKN